MPSLTSRAWNRWVRPSRSESESESKSGTVASSSAVTVIADPNVGPMATLIYSAIASLDGYVADETGNFDWAAPGEEVHAFVNELERPIGTYLYGRRMYDTMVAWETMETEGQSAAIRAYAQIWRAADKIVYSSTLEAPASERTR